MSTLSMLGRGRTRLVELTPGLILLAGIVAAAYAVHSALPYASPIAVAVLLGLVIANTLRWPVRASAGTAFAARRLLRAGVVLLGLQISLGAVREIGLPGVAVVIIVVLGTFTGVQILGRIFGLTPPLRLIMGAGFAVCGVTAVAAVSPIARASRQEVSYAVGLVALCGTLSIAVFPALAALLSMDQVTAGSWVGAGVHDVAQVVATASVIGPAALDAAIIIKLTRVLMLVIVVLLVAWLARSPDAAAVTDAEPRGGVRPRLAPLGMVPPFILAFLGTVVVTSTGALPPAVVDIGGDLARVLLTFGCAALGVGVAWQEIRSLGIRPLLAGLTAWVLVAGLALAAVRAAGL